MEIQTGSLKSSHLLKCRHHTSLLEKTKMVDFHVKTVPGTEVPGRKNWVTSGLETTKNRNSVSDDDIDPEDELRPMTVREENLGKTTRSSNESENDPFEVVRDDFKCDFHKCHTSTGLGLRNNVSCLNSENNVMEKSLLCHKTGKSGEGSDQRPDLCSSKAPEKPPEVFSRRDSQGRNTDIPLSVNRSSGVSAKDKHAEDNQKRLAALEARWKAKELQKKAVHNALANLDSHPEDKPTHTIFGSNSESERRDIHSGAKPPRRGTSRRVPGRASGKLFDSSGDKERCSEEDNNRFRIKPQFEGRAGQKLMNLQSRFGTDSQGLERDNEEEQKEIHGKKTAEEEEFAAEKLKALNVVQSTLQISLSNSTSEGSVAAEKFKDITHCDSMRHGHAAYESRQDDFLSVLI
ncbi:hypothetical protein MJG53_014090 [Ovis ammon polii x Ovis aries]|uniref:Uncharacterized protein n=1 Tax=Ovis ammon polii x Ovis aries TaxID=2918886 RepID=A0ACB9UKG2_9CETA|nr:hypothetical protein MJG53_014090 [Ovis ammon polii x Ovis aries]